MKQAIIKFLLRLLGVHVGQVPSLPIYAIIVKGERVADVTTNKNRAVAIAKELIAKENVAVVWQYAPRINIYSG